MRFGTSITGVIALVSLLVTASPERGGRFGNNQDIDRSSSPVVVFDISRRYYSWFSEVAGLTSRIDYPRGSNYVKNKYGERAGSSRPGASKSRLAGYSYPATARHNDANTETPTTVSRFPIDVAVLTGGRPVARNFESLAFHPRPDDYPIGVRGSRRKASGNKPDTVVTVVSSLLHNTKEKFLVTLDSPISNFISGASIPALTSHRRLRPRRGPPRRGDPARRHERETIARDGETKSSDGAGDKGSSTNGAMKTGQSSNAESAVTMSHRLTTETSFVVDITIASRSFDSNSREASERHETSKIRNSSFNDNGNLEAIDNGPEALNPNFHSRTMYPEGKDLPQSDNPYPTNYPDTPLNNFSTLEALAPIEGEDSYGQRSDEGITESTNRLYNDQFIDSAANDFGQKSLVRHSSERKETNSESSMGITLRKHETTGNGSAGVEIALARQISYEPFEELDKIGATLSKLEGNIDNISLGGPLDNHKAIRARSYQTTEPLAQGDSGYSSLSSHFLDQQTIRDSVQAALLPNGKDDRPTIIANQNTLAKAAQPLLKNSTKQSINLLDGKSNKIFYEIKPSLFTDMAEKDDGHIITTTRRSFDKFLLPSVPSAFGKFGPYFLDEEDRRNVTERIGHTVQLDCRIGMLGHRKVTWLQHYKDSFRLLTVERESYSVDRRISLNFQYPNNWRLQIAYASMRDSGRYKCQVEIDQARSLVKTYNVIITAPVLTITDDSGRPVSGERHLKAGSALKLRCEARDVIARFNESVLWMRGDVTLTDDVSENRTTEIVNENEVTVVISTLLVERAIPRHAGNYSCVVPDKARTTIAVHVLNGELPAAVQHGSGVSTAVLNIWLVHLTASYGFFR